MEQPDLTKSPLRYETMIDGVYFKKLNELITNPLFLIDVAEACSDAYKNEAVARVRKDGGQPEEWLSQPTFTDEEKRLLLQDPSKLSDTEQMTRMEAQKVLATNLGGFYAVQEGIGLLQSLEGDRNPHVAYVTLKYLADPQNSAGNKNPSRTHYEHSGSRADIFGRFAHATWLAAQPFRGREKRLVVQSYDTLTGEERAKDMVQVNAAAKVLLSWLNKT